MTDLHRKRGETFESFLRRFNRRLLQSGRLIQARKIRFFKTKKNRTQTKRQALRKKDLREKHEYLQKIGKLPEEDKHKKRRRY